MSSFLAPLGGYLLGSIAFSVLVVRRATGEDVRRHGSGNAGATNVLRTAGRGPALLTMVGDVGKGVVAVMAARWLEVDTLWVGLTALAAIVGHVYPVFFAFRGGKGVATAAGTFLALAPVPTLSVLPVFVLVIAATRYVSVGSVTTAALLPVSCWAWAGPLSDVAGGRFSCPREFVGVAVAVGLLVIIKHQTNLVRLARGGERKLGEPREGA